MLIVCRRTVIFLFSPMISSCFILAFKLIVPCVQSRLSLQSGPQLFSNVAHVATSGRDAYKNINK